MKTLLGRGVLQCLARFASCAVANGIFPAAFAATKTWSAHKNFFLCKTKIFPRQYLTILTHELSVEVDIRKKNVSFLLIFFSLIHSAIASSPSPLKLWS